MGFVAAPVASQASSLLMGNVNLTTTKKRKVETNKSKPLEMLSTLSIQRNERVISPMTKH
jgi:hypothetical protein